MGDSGFSNVCNKPTGEDILQGWVKIALCKLYLLLICLPAVKPAVSLYKATTSQKNLFFFGYPEDGDSKLL
jgi:hypothetical protein